MDNSHMNYRLREWAVQREELERQFKALSDNLHQILEEGSRKKDSLDVPSERGSTFKSVVQDQLIVCGIYQEAHDTDPDKAVHDLINWHVEVALEPNVSERALRLLNTVPPDWAEADDVETF